MNANSYEAEKPVEKQKSGAQVVHTSAVHRFPVELSTPEARAERAAKSSVDYWKKIVAPRVIRGKPTAELYVRLRKDGRDLSVCLNTANKATAATKARDLWVKVEGIGLAAALAEFRPKSAPRPARSATVGELLAEAKAISTVRASTLAEYEIRLRRLVAGVLGMSAEGSVFYHKSAEAKAWRAKVDGASLDVLAAAKVESWRKAYIAAAPDEVARISARNTSSAVIRNARGFFTKSMAKALSEKIRLPDPLPLVGLPTGSATRRFKSTIDPRQLYAAALAELSGDVLTAFLICITAGLRKGEADMLPWANVDLDGALATVAPTKWFLPKTEESQRSTPIPPDVVAHLRACRAKAPAAEFVLSGLDPAKARDAKKYRCPCWKLLAPWLRAKGFVTPNPIHELRKLSGSLVNALAGLEAARRHLGHRNISTTAASYVTGSAALVNLAAPVGTEGAK
ncbi:MAG: site-specific integrase [Pedosphaera sp.]|nr:site-specific integrase [Pedosphaera sp.]